MCDAAKCAAYRVEHRARLNEAKHWDAMWRLYGLTKADYMEMFDAQDGRCALCREPETAMKNGRPMWLAVDHNHRTGRLRKLLCYACNRSRVGRHEAGLSWLKKAADYVAAHD